MAFAAAVLLAPSLAFGHQVGVSYSELTVADRTVMGRLKLAVREVADGLRLDRDGDGAVTERDLALAGQQLFPPTLGAMALSADGERCRLVPEAAALEAPDGLVLTGRWICPRPIEHLQVRVGFLSELPRGHTHLARIEVDAQTYERVARAGIDTFSVEGPPRWTAQAARFLALGVEHIFTGYDHIAFLIGLLLLGGSLRGLARVVTSFTAAHSVTLALSALGLVTPPARLVEPLIAASIVFVAVENLWAMRGDISPTARLAAAGRRWRIAFAFGLVHGFGFASVLRELHLPRGGLAMSLVTFNLGVELGQMAIVASILPLLVLLRRTAGFVPQGVRLGSLGVGALGLFWLIQRAVGLG